VRALDGLSFSVEEGTVFGLLGPNGAGKSTTAKVLTTLARSDEGKASVAGHDVLREPSRVRRSIGVVAQRSGVDRDLTGRENMRLQGHLQGMRGRELDRRVDELLEQLGLADAARRVARTYSGGMQRRLDIAMGLVHGPRVLFLDEPTTGLDPEVRAAMWREIERLKADEGLTILLTTHYMEEADQLASQVAIVDRGRVVAEGSPAELKASLDGEAVHVELDGANVNGNVDAALRGVPGLRDVLVEGRALHARVDDGARADPAVLAALDSHSVPVAMVTVALPSLDDVYLRYAGRSFAEADKTDQKEENE
jgi:ABC-2 type transport system ATP-binding protein